MSKLNALNDQEYIFGTLFIVSNKLDTLLDRELSAYDMTSKQWFLSVVINTLFEHPPTLKELAKEMGTSHQNIKQVALKLQNKGLLSMRKDERDGRATVLEMNKDQEHFWQNLQEPSEHFKRDLFKDIDQRELLIARSVLSKLWDNLKGMEQGC